MDRERSTDRIQMISLPWSFTGNDLN